MLLLLPDAYSPSSPENEQIMFTILYIENLVSFPKVFRKQSFLACLYVKDFIMFFFNWLDFGKSSCALKYPSPKCLGYVQLESTSWNKDVEAIKVLVTVISQRLSGYHCPSKKFCNGWILRSPSDSCCSAHNIWDFVFCAYDNLSNSRFHPFFFQFSR